MEAALAAIEKTGLGLDNEEFVDGMVACSVPIKDANDRLFAFLFTHAPTVRKSLDDLVMLAPHLRRAASELGSLVDQQPATA